jgi:flavin-dependent dehydrogenase
LFDGGYAGLLLQENGTANLCLSVSRERMAAAGTPAELVAGLEREAPLLAERLGDAQGPWEAIAGVPYGWRAQSTAAGLYRIGDQAAVIASLAGDGIAIALDSGAAAAEALLRGEDVHSFQRGFARRARRPLAIAEMLRHMAEAPVRRRLMIGLARVPGLARMAARLTRIAR